MNDGKGVLQAPAANGGTVFVGTDPREVTLEDINGDGQLDMLVANRSNSTFNVIPGKGDGTFASQVSADGRVLANRITMNLGCRIGWTVKALDVDGDGFRDIIASCEQSDTNDAARGGFKIFHNGSR